MQLHSNGIVSIQRACNRDQSLGKVCIDSPVAGFIRISQGGARDRAAEPHMVELATNRSQAGFDIPQALAVSQLRKGHGEKLIATG